MDKMWWFVAVGCLIQATSSSGKLTRRKRDGNPELHMNVSQWISYNRYPCKEYEVLTKDGYYLTINRIPFGRKNLMSKDPTPVVFLQHGLFTEARSWVANMPYNSLAYILADAGYDVWLGNNRGTSWSQRHQNLSVDQEEFWDFSFHEMAMFDLPAMINFILQKTGQKQLYYIGHSQGTTIGFIAFSAMPELSQKIKMFFALAPLISIEHAPSPVLRLLRSVSEKFVKNVLIGKEFVFSRKPVRKIVSKLCSGTFMRKFCIHLIFSIGGFNATNINTSRADIYTAYFPDGGSVKTILHWRQVAKSGVFRCFDYGSENQAKYNQNFPPSYNLQDMIVPTSVWSGEKDLIADPKDVAILLPQIKNRIYYHNFSDWNHWDFVLGLNAPQRLYYRIIDLMGKSL
ncbi:lysosomal acid lipase/cholesteryl ester hydrolase-like [Eublepharis macularius]|uniref:Lipase n=1 Tax=Eublepharis macularius TaxID=481883 RepID=A0AA97JIV9_EUBMA|nr:lysosomal acid lipase/cholesteryl ester hydrolase-like [Eublepharis macularius]